MTPCAKFAFISVAVAWSVVSSACSDDTQRTVFLRAPSPDNQWVATAQEDRHSGPGTAGLYIEVSLQRVRGDNKPIQILLLEGDYPISEYPGRHLQLRWTDPTHLELGYRDAKVDFQAVRCAGLQISTLELSPAAGA